MAATGIPNERNTFETRDDCKCLFKRNTVPLYLNTVASALLGNSVSIEEWFAAATFAK